MKKLTKDLRINLLIVVTLALGLGVNTTVFSVVNGFLLKSLPFKDAARLVFIQESKPPDFPECARARPCGPRLACGRSWAANSQRTKIKKGSRTSSSSAVSFGRGDSAA